VAPRAGATTNRIAMARTTSRAVSPGELVPAIQLRRTEADKCEQR
jgi:hypothetical protein